MELDGDRLASVSSLGLTRTLGHAPSPPTPSAQPSPSVRPPPSVPQRAPSREAHPGASSYGPGDPSRSDPLDDDESVSRPCPQPPTLGEDSLSRPGQTLLIGACFHELKARALAVHDKRREQPLTREVPAYAPEADERAREAEPRREPEETAVTMESPAGTSPPGLGGNPGDGRAGIPLDRWVMPLVTRPEGFLVEAQGVVLRAKQGVMLGRRLDDLATQTHGLMTALSMLPGRWVAVA